MFVSVTMIQLNYDPFLSYGFVSNTRHILDCGDPACPVKYSIDYVKTALVENYLSYLK